MKYLFLILTKIDKLRFPFIKLFLITLFVFLFSCKSSYIVELPEEKIPDEQIQKEIEVDRDSAFLDLIFKKKTKIALLLPISGKYDKIGNELLNAAHLSLYENDPKNRIELVVFDSKGTEFGARRAIREIISQDIKIVIGPLFSAATESVIDIVADHDIILLSLSNNDNLQGKKNIFVTGIDIEQQIERLVEYSMDKGLNSFSIVAPNNSYGLKVANSLRDVAKGKDGYFVASSFYKNQDQINKSVAKIINSYSISQSAYDDLSDEDKEKSLAEIPISNEDKIYSDVILVADSGDNLDLVLNHIDENNIDKRAIQIIGLKEWDKMSTLYNVRANGSWFTSSNPDIYKKYEYLYYDHFKKIPNRVTSVVYDMVWSVINLSYDNGDVQIDDFILEKSGFEGVDGSFRFLDNGIVQRNFAILEVTDNKFQIIDPDSRYFLKY
ncbi:penicillin-binding protein activator [Rickettsiales bacterium]|nr:penicillin-binding protein activator [Rickettsiales bacterium]